jgi:hypothetical protein
MRLLIAVDTVTGLPAQILRHPDRFKLTAAQADAAAAQIRLEIEQMLAAHTFSYTRSNGKPRLLRLKDVRDRAERLELAYNANDCVEVRWGEQEDSEEFSSCQRRAPEEQRARMQRYRAWFHTRTRPPRGALDSN